jgi:hypothetical protein
LQGEGDIDDNNSMPTWWAVVEALRDGLARLADVAPNEIVVLSEESDWGLVGSDLRDAIKSQLAETAPPESDRPEELVEA